jgi:hypothetical protein
MAPSDNDRAAWFAMAASAAMIAYHVASKAVRDSLFLTSFEVNSLPVMVIVASVFSVVSVLATSRAMTRFTPARLVPVAFGTSAVLQMAVWFGLNHFPRAGAVVLYLQIVGLGALLTSGFWSVLNERFDPRTAKQQVSRIAGAGTFGGIVGGVMAERIAAMFSTQQVVPVLAIFHLICGLLLGRIAGHGAGAAAQTSSEENSGAERRSTWRVLMEAPYLRTLATLVILGTISAAMIDFVFKSHAVSFHGRGENLTRFFAVFYSSTGVLTFVVQVALSSAALRRLGLAKTVGTLPFAVSVGGLTALVLPGLTSTTLARGMEAVFRGSLFRSGYELFYTPIPTNEKRAAKSVVDVGFDRMGDAFGSGLVSIMLALGPVIATHAILTGAILVALAGVWVASRLHNAYIDALERGLLERAGALDLNQVGDSVALTGILESMTVVYPTTAFSSQPAPARRRRISQATTHSEAPLALKPVEPVSDNPAPGPAPAALASGSLQSDPILRWINDLRSGDINRVRKVLQEAAPLKAHVIPYVISLLAWDQAYPDAGRALQAVAGQHTGQLVDALLDENTDFSIRRRLPRLLTSSPGQRTAEGLLAGLSDKRFEVRFQCGRALVHCVERNPNLRIEQVTIFDAIRREVMVSRPVWESHRLLDRAEDRDASPFVDEFLRNRASRSLEHVFTLLALVLPAEPLRIAFKGLHTDDPQLRGTSLEYLESILPDDVRERLWPLLESQSTSRKRADTRPVEEVIAELMKSNESIIINLTELRKKTGSGE